MSDIAKWGILVGAIILIIGSIVGLTITRYIDGGVFADAIATIVSVAGDGLKFGRGLINNLLSPWARSALTGLLIWLLAKWLVTWTIKVGVWVYHYIFK